MTKLEKVKKGWEVVTELYSEHRYAVDMVLAFFKAGLALVILAFFITNFVLTLETRDDIQNLRDTEELAFSSISIIHEMAKERGMSNLVVTSKGTAFQQRARNQRIETDRVVSQSWNTLVDFQDKGNSATQGLVKNILISLNNLNTTRWKIDTLNLTAPQVVAFYTTLINNLIDVPAKLDRPDAGKVVTAVQAYIAFAHFKDKLGLQRATTTAPLWRGRFTSTTERDTVYGHIHTQDAFVNIFNLTAKSSESLLLADLKTQPVWTNYTNLASQVMATTSGNFSVNFTYDDWWDTITPAIDATRDIVESSLQNSVVTYTDDALANLETLIIINSFGMALTIVIVLGYIFMIFFNASFALAKYWRQRQQVSSMANEMKEGEDHNWE